MRQWISQLEGEALERFKLQKANDSHRRRLASQAARFVITPRDWQRLVARYRGRCAYCGASAELTMDHVVPLVQGGRHSIGNLVPACLTCNCSKRERFLTEWRRAQRGR
ncbi:HNH endonuclease [Streptomyces tendae]